MEAIVTANADISSEIIRSSVENSEFNSTLVAFARIAYGSMPICKWRRALS